MPPSPAQVQERHRALDECLADLHTKCIRAARAALGPGGWQERDRGGCIAVSASECRYFRQPFSTRAVFAINASYHQMQMYSVVHEPEYVFSAIRHAFHETHDGQVLGAPTDTELYDRVPHRLRVDKVLASAEPLFVNSQRAKYVLARPEAHACAVWLIEEIKRLAESKDWSPKLTAHLPGGGYSYGIPIRMNPDWLPRDPRAAAPPKASKTGIAFKHRMTVDPGRDAAFATSGIFDAPKAPRFGPKRESRENAAAREQASFEEAQRRFAMLLQMLAGRDQKDYDRCKETCIARARRSDMLHRMCHHLR